MVRRTGPPAPPQRVEEDSILITPLARKEEESIPLLYSPVTHHYGPSSQRALAG